MSMNSARAAEALAASHLEELGFEILARNWRNRRAEIDIVAKYSDCVHFVEVKYRRSDAFGAAAEYVTPQKAARLRLGARYWLAAQGWQGDYQIDVVAIEGALENPRLQVFWSAVTAEN